MKDQVIENMSEVCHEEWMGWSKDISKELYVVVDVLKKDIEYFREDREYAIKMYNLAKEGLKE